MFIIFLPFFFLQVVENFLWNMTMLTTQTNLLKNVYEQSCTVIDQVRIFLILKTLNKIIFHMF